MQRARRSLAGGVSSPFRSKAPVPLFFREGAGPRLTDVDGNTYIDYGLAWGPMILGYSHPRVVGAMQEQAAFPLTFGAQHELEFEVAERLQRVVPCAERVMFTSSGSEAVHLAMRLSRAFTGRRLILKFEGHYHGWFDSILVSYRPAPHEIGTCRRPRALLGSRGQTESTLSDVVVARWNDLETVAEIFEEMGGDIAAVIMEPVLCNGGGILPEPGYLEAIRELCSRNGALLIFDEIITGFRLELAGAQKFYGVTPDLATFGKAVAGGAALSVVAGRAEILMQVYDGGVAFGGTFNGAPLSLCAARCAFDELSQDGGAPLERANRLGEAFAEEIRALGAKHGLPLLVSGFGTAFSLHFTEMTALREYRDTLHDDRELLKRFVVGCLAEGQHFLPDGRVYLSVVHGEREIRESLAAIDRVFGSLR